MALGAGLVFPSRRSIDACCACKSERATARLLSTEGKEEAQISQGSMRGFKARLCSQSKSKTINIVLPKLHHCAGEIGSVHNGVVCVTLLCIPGIVA